MKILIIGGSIGGLTAATRCRRINDQAEITVIDENSEIGCNLPAIPAFASGTIKDLSDLTYTTEEDLSKVYNIILKKSTKAISIDKTQKAVLTRNLITGKSELLLYDKLILATGKNILLPKDLPRPLNLFVLRNQFDALKIASYLEKTLCEKITIIGFNFYSLLVTNYFIRKGYDITIISENDELENFDPEIKQLIINELIKTNVKLFLKHSIKKIILSDKELNLAAKIKLNNDHVIDTNLIIYMENPVLNIELARKAELQTKNGRIIVDKKMKTSDPSIYAIGSIALSFNAITEKGDSASLINDTILQARIASSDIFNIEINYKGIIENRVLKINNLYVGYTGINTKTAKECFNDSKTLTIYTTSSERFEGPSKKIMIKLIFHVKTKKILGAQLFGYDRSIDKFLDVLHTAIYSNLTADDLIHLNLSYSPEFSIHSSPLNVLGLIANDLSQNLISIVKFEELENNDYFILDIRTPNEYKKIHVENAVNIPLIELRERLKELPKDKYILIYCNTGKISYIAERILKSNGFEKVATIEGGLSSIKLIENFY